MTMLNGWVRGGAVHLMTDSLTYDDTGLITGHAQKIFVFGTMRTAVACRGLSALVPSLSLAIYNRFTDFDGLVEEIGPVLQEMLRHTRKITSRPFDEGFELLIGGWSDARQAPVLAFVSDHGPAPWQVIDTGGTFLAPGNDAMARRLSAIGLDPLGPEFNPEADGARLARQQRVVTMHPSGASEPVRLIGGAVELVTIAQHEIRSRIVKRWPDHVGEQINSLAAHASASPSAAPVLAS